MSGDTIRRSVFSLAPGLSWRRRKDGVTGYWIAPRAAVKLRFAPRTRLLWSAPEMPSDEDMRKISEACRALQAEAVDWINSKGARKSRVNKRPGFVYFIRCLDAVKIGFATNTAIRFSTLQIASPHTMELLASIPGTQIDERLIHAKFAHLRTRGEWFALNDEILSFIKNTEGTDVREIGAVRLERHFDDQKTA